MQQKTDPILKYLYVLVSDSNDFYYEQLLVSITSLQLVMPQAFISLLLDHSTLDSLVGTRESIKNLVAEIIPIQIDCSFSKKEKSRFLKTNMRNYVDGDFLFIDCDTIITKDLSLIINEKGDFAAVLDKHSKVSQHAFKNEFYSNAKKLNFSPYINDQYYNSGVLFVRETTENHMFFSRWHELWQEANKKKIVSDQVSLAQTNFDFGYYIQELNGIWNCQLEFGISFFAEAKILHFFTAEKTKTHRPYLFMNSEPYLQIKKDGKINESLMLSIKNSKNCFIGPTQIIDFSVIEILQSSVFQFIQRLYCYSRFSKIMFKTLNIISAKILFLLSRIKS